MLLANCKNCNKEFSYKWHGRGNSCSPECTSAIVIKSKLKYTNAQISMVISLKGSGSHNSQIVQATGVKLSKVKEIVKENNLFLTKEERQARAYQSKLSLNPDAMTEMRSAYRTKATSEDALKEISKLALSCGYEYVSGFKGKSKPFKIRCLRCQNIRETSKVNTIIKNTCGYCSGSTKTSAAEIEIKEWFESLGLKVNKYKFAERAGGIEIDVYLPDLKVGIEYCGLYWHNEESPTPRPIGYHSHKLAKANRDGIRLITIFQDEWRDRKEQVKGFLLSVVHKNSRKLFARKTQLRSLSKEEARAFMNLHHIQGATRFDASFGLFFGDELLGAVSGSTHHRPGKKATYVLNRLAFKNDVAISGGSSRLLKALISYARSQGFKTITSWSDNRWSEGKVYDQIGFKLDGKLKDDYSYVDGQDRISKQSCQKKFLIVKGAIGSTESEMAKSLGYKKIWDCGKKRWVLDIR